MTMYLNDEADALLDEAAVYEATVYKAAVKAACTVYEVAYSAYVAAARTGSEAAIKAADVAYVTVAHLVYEAAVKAAYTVYEAAAVGLRAGEAVEDLYEAAVRATETASEAAREAAGLEAL